MRTLNFILVCMEAKPTRKWPITVLEQALHTVQVAAPGS